MSDAPEINGLIPAQFEPVREAFAANFENDGELGARFTLAIDGEVVLDLYGGHADRERTRPFDATTLTSIFSTAKMIAGLMVARLVDAGRLSYGQPVADVWPEFAQGGKDKVTVEQVMSHQAGLPGFVEPIDQALWWDWDAVCARLAAMTPLWPPGTASGYHPVTYGYLAGEIFRRVDGRPLAQALAEDISRPLGVDLWIGLPDGYEDRRAEIVKPRAMPKFGQMNEAVKAAFLTRWAMPGGVKPKGLLRSEVLSANTYATADALARVVHALACDGEAVGGRLLRPGVAGKMISSRIRGQDLVLPFELSWGAGVLRNDPVGVYGPGKDTVGHSGWGGACAFADPERRMSGAYVMNKQSSHLIGDPRARALIDAVYGCL